MLIEYAMSLVKMFKELNLEQTEYDALNYVIDKLFNEIKLKEAMKKENFNNENNYDCN